MPTLHWVGKDKVVNHHHDVPFRVLNKVSTFAAPEGLPTNTTDNRIIHGDNLEALKSLLPEFEAQVKCIYIDPPYNTGNEGWVYNDAVNDPKMKRCWVPCDHVPVRSWPLFRARQLMRDVIESFKQEQTS